jgi:hypothetical protein
MKKLVTLFILACSVLSIQAQPGIYAGTKKGLINTVYTNSRNIPALSGWTFVQGSVLNAYTDQEAVLVNIYKKGTSFLVFFSIETDSILQKKKIVDVLEVKPVAKGWTVKAAFCLLDNFDNPWIVAWAKITPTEYLKTLKKAWRFDPEKKQIELVKIKGISCLNEGFDTP